MYTNTHTIMSPCIVSRYLFNVTRLFKPQRVTKAATGKKVRCTRTQRKREREEEASPCTHLTTFKSPNERFNRSSEPCHFTQHLQVTPMQIFKLHFAEKEGKNTRKHIMLCDSQWLVWRKIKVNIIDIAYARENGAERKRDEKKVRHAARPSTLAFFLRHVNFLLL